MKAKFEAAEDIHLAEAVSRHGKHNWQRVAEELPGRNARPCRERWSNYVSPDLVQGAWTDNEDAKLLSKFNQVGREWQRLMPWFPDRSRNSIKNRLTTLQSREQEKKRQSVTKDESVKIDPIAQAERQANPPASKCDTMSLLDSDANDWFNRWSF
jgi:hypothetical protein